jgi:hypothetical protein
MDLMDMQKYAKYNKGNKYVLVVIDVFSRFLWTQPCLSKSSDNSLKAIKEIFNRTDRRPRYIRSDKGMEFLNKIVQNFFKEEKVKYIVTQSESKAAIAERVIKTVKGRIMKYMYHKQNYKYINVLDDITKAYNNSYHRVIRRTPISVTKKEEDELWYEMYASDIRPYVIKGNTKKSIIDVGQYVRISFLRHVFSREYRQKWSSEIFQVYKRQMRDGIIVYWVRDLSGEEILGSFYRHEILQVDVNPKTLYKIEKIIRSKKLKNGKKMFYVKWLNWGSKFNSWINEEDMEDL